MVPAMRGLTRRWVVKGPDDGSFIEELNAFLRSHKVLTVDRRWVEEGAGSFWQFRRHVLQQTSVSDP